MQLLGTPCRHRFDTGTAWDSTLCAHLRMHANCSLLCLAIHVMVIAAAAASMQHCCAQRNGYTAGDLPTLPTLLPNRVVAITLVAVCRSLGNNNSFNSLTHLVALPPCAHVESHGVCSCHIRRCLIWLRSAALVTGQQQCLVHGLLSASKSAALLLPVQPSLAC